MKKTAIKVGLTLAIFGIGFAGMSAISASGQQETEKEVVDTRPVVSVESLMPEDYDVVITAHGEVKPLESTMLAAQVAGEVSYWHPSFVAGGLIKRGDVLMSIEKDTYEAALLRAQAEYQQASAQLIEERARAKVAADEARNLPKSKVTDLYLRKPQLLSAEAAVKSAEAGLRIAQRDLDDCQVLAPYDALVVSRNVGVGQFVNRGEVVGHLNNVETAEVILPIAGFDNMFLPERLEGAQANILSEGFRNFEREGVISRDLGVVDGTTRMSALVVRIEDPYGLETNQPAMKFGSYVEVSFVGQTLKDVYRIPQELVNNRVVWLMDDENKLEGRQVEIAREEGAYFLVSGGLSRDEKVVMTLPEYPQNGLEVKLTDTGTGLVASAATAGE